ncbi:hemoglobin/transferrin/lactoferrin receptor protein [Saccharicrinis carchari]|uniref:Hemoglobin/transferrin/lactoferrin receptor protein n=1 Tax=Saccharicrinis carchari TaxID=1168039 RepID=A0A521BUM6_SACCC|nr:TonB-dependent receptor [Saccharicrinis carchari]SMO50882.1 hemoglobin/transferrin/lactoferrin receptor protein [Saccharicrinis carchari]
MHTLNKACILWALLLLHTVSFAQKIKIFDKETHLPIAHVVVFSESENFWTISDNNGIVNITAFNRAEDLYFRHPAYELLFIKGSQALPNTVELLPKMFTLDEFVVSASRSGENKKKIPYFVETIKPHSIEFNNAPTGADILSTTGYVAVQKSQGGGGSPILRGFEANRVLLVMDGVRMNNAIYRSGHLQNSITIDPNILEKTEVLFGPSSVIYGSDALGGVVSYFSKDPVLSNDSIALMDYQASVQTLSVSNSLKTNININAGFKHWASLSSFTFSNFGNITMGKNRPDNTDNDWGKVFHYARRINGRDSMMVNSNPNTQMNTGYQQYDLLQKVKYSPSQNHDLVLNAQYSTSSNISRFDQLNDYDGDYLKFAQYYYGPQKRLFISFNSRLKSNNQWFNHLNTIVSYQKIKESRHSRIFNNNNRLSQEEFIDIYSFNMDFVKEINTNNKINYGIELLFNDMASKAKYTNIENGNSSAAPTRYPGGGSFFQAYSAYANYNKTISAKLILDLGARFGSFSFNSTFTDNPEVTELSMNTQAPSASFGLVYSPGSTWKFSGVAATGFRAPNVDDYGKIRAKNEEISMPNPLLKPEYAFNVELSATRSFLNENLILNITTYNTWLYDAIVRKYAPYQGKDSVEYNGQKYRVYINSNEHKAVVNGFSAGMHAQAASYISFNASLNYTRGKVVSTNEPMGHIVPLFGKIGATYRHKNFKATFYMNYQAQKKARDMSPYGEDNEEEGSANGFPAWQSLNVAAQYQLIKAVTLQASAENLLDRHYKTFASAISAPGRNLIISISARF